MDRMSQTPKAQKLAVAVVQWEVVFGDAQANRKASLPLLQQAASEGAQLVVLPELCNTGYGFSSNEEVHAWAEPLDGETVSFWIQAAKDLGIVIAGGLAEREGDKAFNSLVLVDGDGVVGCYRKIHLFDREKRWFQAGHAWVVVPVCGTQVGLMICYDSWFPESARILTLMGAEVILMAGCVRHESHWTEPQGTPVASLQLANAHVNSVFVASALRSGEEKGDSFSGQSCVWGPHGRVMEPGPVDGSFVGVVTLPLVQARFKRKTKRVHPIQDRREDTYSVLTQRDGQDER
ncbi:MAG: hydratase [Deltaproteobacteria bacterium]|nr:MAG: hydratase [Deltaproteobacteria bacterium]